MSRFKIFRSCAAAVLAAFLLSSCGSEAATPLPQATGQTLRIVSSLPFKGPGAQQANLIRNAIDLAIDESRYLLPGWKIEHVALDGGDDETGETTAKVEAANARGAANDPSVFAYIGPYTSGAAMVSLPILNQAGLLQGLPVATWPGLTQTGWAHGEPERYYPTGTQTMVRLTPPDSAQARVAARKAHALGATTAVVVSDESDYSQGMADTFKDEAGRLGIEVLVMVNISQDPPNWTAASQPVDAIFFAPSSLSIAEAAAVQIGEHPPRIGVFSTDVLLSDRLSTTARRQMEGWYISFNGDLTPGEPDRFSAFARKFEDRFGVAPTQAAVNTYDLTAAVLDAASRVGVHRQKILEEVLAGRYEAGVGGPLSFNPNGDRQGGELTLYRLTNGEFQVLEEVPAP